MAQRDYGSSRARPRIHRVRISPRQSTAVDGEHGAMHETGIVRRQKRNQGRDLLRFTESPCGNRGEHAGVQFSRISRHEPLLERAHHSRGDRTGGERIDANAGARPFGGGTSGDDR